MYANMSIPILGNIYVKGTNSKYSVEPNHELMYKKIIIDQVQQYTTINAQIDKFLIFIDDVRKSHNYTKIVELLKQDNLTEGEISSTKYIDELYLESELLFQYILSGIFENENDHIKEILLSSIMYSNVNIFSTWFKSQLHKLISSSSKTISEIALNIQNTYRDYFLSES